MFWEIVYLGTINKNKTFKGDESTYRKFFYNLCQSDIFKKAMNNFIITIPKKYI